MFGYAGFKVSEFQGFTSSVELNIDRDRDLVTLKP